MKHLAIIKWPYILLLLLVSLFSLKVYAQNSTAEKAKVLFKKAEEVRYTKPNEALEYYNGSLGLFLQNNDTAHIIKIKHIQVGIYSGLAKYQRSYDVAWSLLPYLQKPQYVREHVQLLHKMITLYMIYQQYDKAKATHDKAMGLIHQYIVDKRWQAELKGRCYSLNGWIESETSKDYIKAEKLILKCIELFGTDGIDKHKVDYTKLQLAQLYIIMYRLDEAFEILKQVDKTYRGKTATIKCLLYEYFGRYYQKTNQLDSAIYYFSKATEVIDYHKAHISNKVDILKNISDIYAQKGDTKNAYKYLIENKALNDSVFSSTSAQNKKLFEIKDKYEAELRLTQEEIRTHQLTALEREKQFWLFKLIGVILLLLVIAGGIWFYYSKRTHQFKIEQRFLKQKQAEVLEIKNKELLSSALQLIEKDALQQEIKRKLERLNVKDENVPIIKQITNSLNTDKSNKWKEFETHFTSVNNEFYTLLQVKYPKLTATDLKICAFIKLGFSSKDMAQIMGIGVEGINTTRSRLRKKMNLEREVVLADYLQGLVVNE